MLLGMQLFDGERMPLTMAGKIQKMPLAVQHLHRRRMSATWKKWNLSLNARAVFHARQLLKKSESLQQMFTASSPTARGNEKFVHTCAQPWPKSHACSSCHHPSAALEKLSQCIPRSHFNVCTVMDAFIWPLAENTEWRMACLNVTEDENCTAQPGCSESHTRHVLQPKWTSSWPSRAKMYDSQWPILLRTLAA